MTARVLRSLLFVPGDNPHRVEKAFNSGADAVIIDLEDAVAVAKKPQARASLPDLLAIPHSCPVYVRVNAMDTEFCLADLEMVVEAGADGVSLPKVERVSDVIAVDWILAQRELAAGKEVGGIDLIPVLESAAGLMDARTILSATSRAKRAGLGLGDFMLQLNLTPGPDEAEVWPYRSMLVLASNAAGIEGPLDTVYLDLKNFEGLRAACEKSKRHGFQGRRCIHPSQIEIINEVYSPTAAEIERAERIIAEFNQAETSGLASIRVNGEFVDYAIVKKAEVTLAARDAMAAAKRG